MSWCAPQGSRRCRSNPVGKLSEGADDADDRIRECERRIANVTDALAKLGWSDALAARLREEEAQLGVLKSERRAAPRDAVPSVIPSSAAIARSAKTLLALAEKERAHGRELLSRFVSPVVMTPEIEGPVRRYRATGAFKLAFFLSDAAASRSRSGKSGCAGPQLDFPDEQFRELPEAWVPFEYAVSVGWA